MFALTLFIPINFDSCDCEYSQLETKNRITPRSHSSCYKVTKSEAHSGLFAVVRLLHNINYFTVRAERNIVLIIIALVRRQWPSSPHYQRYYHWDYSYLSMLKILYLAVLAPVLDLELMTRVAPQ